MFVRIAILLVLTFALWGIAARESGASGPTRTYVVRPGDTLWLLAERFYAGDPRKGVWEIEQRNDLDSVSIVPGQRIVVPAHAHA